MTNTYFVCFQAGTSGRFVSGITWNLINQLELPYEYSEVNSAHKESPWALSWDVSSLRDGSMNHPQIFEEFNFVQTTSHLNPNGYGLLNTHMFPDFHTIQRRFPSAKVILLTYTPDDFYEICLNNVLKNGVEMFKKNDDLEFLKKSKMFFLFSDILYYIHGKTIDVREHEYSVNDIQTITQHYYKNVRRYLSNSPFANPDIPTEYVTRTLTLPYNDLFTKTSTGYLGLDKLCGFTNSNLSDIIYKTYSDYVDGRQRLVRLYEIERD